MSLVGPRPEVLEYTNLYRGEELLILAMRPGLLIMRPLSFPILTIGWGLMIRIRISGNTFFRGKNELRVKYVRNWALAEDLKILWCTIARVTRKFFKR